MARIPWRRWKSRWMPASARARAFFLRTPERALGCWWRGRSGARSAAGPDQSGSSCRRLSTASITGLGAGGSKARVISLAVQPRAGAAAEAQASASAWEIGGGGEEDGAFEEELNGLAMAGFAPGDAGAGGEAAEGGGERRGEGGDVIEGKDPIVAREGEEVAGEDGFGVRGEVEGSTSERRRRAAKDLRTDRMLYRQH